MRKLIFLSTAFYLTITALTCFCGAMTPIERERHFARLFTVLTGSYNKSLIPAPACPNPFQAPCPFVVQTRLFLIRIQDLIENQENLVSTVRFQLGWVDPFLTWNPADYGGIDSIMIPGTYLWVPDLQIANSVDDMYSLLSSKSFGFRVTNDGQVWWHPTGKITTRCAMDLTYYPFDYQRCSIVVESVIYNSKELQLDVRADKRDRVSLSMFTPNERWELVDSTAFSVYYVSTASTRFSRVHFWLALKRDPTYYQNTYLIPIALLSIMQVFTYLIPMRDSGRVNQATVVLLTAFVLEGTIGDALPRSHQQSLVQTYLNILIGISVATIALCIILIEILEPDEGFDWWGLLWVSKQVSMKRKIFVKPVSDENEQKDKKVPSKSTLLAAIINLIGFVVCLVIIIVYPAVVFVNYVSDTPPPLPLPPPDNISISYYAELQ